MKKITTEMKKANRMKGFEAYVLFPYQEQYYEIRAYSRYDAKIKLDEIFGKLKIRDYQIRIIK